VDSRRALRLLVVEGPDKGMRLHILPGGRVIIGRSKRVQCRLSDPRVSRVHCAVHAEPDGLVVTDANSAGGTFVNDERVNRHRLLPGERLCVGHTVLCLEAEEAVPASGAPVRTGRDMPAAQNLSGGETATVRASEGTSAQAAPPPSGSWLGRLAGQIMGPYELIGIIAEGHTGTVFHARDTRSGDRRAVKLLKPEFSGSDAERHRFVRGMKTMLGVQHANIVRIYHAAKSHGYCWAAMEYVDGPSLAQLIHNAVTAGHLDWRVAYRVAVHIGRALDHAHRLHIVHRNVTPNNIIIRTSDNVAKLGDLMLVKSLEESSGASAQSHLVGDIHYMPPEATYGMGSRDDPRADVYSLGAVLYSAVTGRPPFQAATAAETIALIRGSEPFPPRRYQMGVPDEFSDIILKALAKRPAQRYPGAPELSAELERCGRALGVLA
jgi:serine/threonine protein kinase